MTHYPVFLNLRERPVLVVGAGKVALRKTLGLVEAGARVTVVAPESRAEFAALPVRLLPRPFEPADLEGQYLAFAATDQREVNRGVREEARRRGIPVNVADAPDECDFVVPARLQRAGVQIAISTGGKDPRRAAGMRRKLEELLPPKTR
jgi:siroheme synthase-like protein